MPNNNTLATAIPIGLLGPVSQIFQEFVGSIDRSDLYRFELTENSEVNFLLSNLSEPGQLELIVDIDGDGNIDFNDDVEFDDVNDFVDSAADRSIVRTLPAGIYWANVYTSRDTHNTGYTLTASAIPTATLVPDPGNTLATALDLGVLSGEQTFSDAVGSADQSDLYRFELTENSEVNFLLSNLSEPGQLELIVDIDGDGNINFNDDVEFDDVNDFVDSAADRSIVRTLPAGIYWANVYTSRDTHNTGYTLTASAIPTATLVPDPGNTLATALDLGMLSGEQTFSDAVGSADQSDLYRFELTENSEVNFLLSNLSEPGQLELIVDIDGDGNIDFNEDIEVDNVNDFVDSTEDRFISVELSAGTYWANVYTSRDTHNTGYTLTVSGPPNAPVPPDPVPPVIPTPNDQTLVSLGDGNLGIIDGSTGEFELIDANIIFNDIASNSLNQRFGTTSDELYSFSDAAPGSNAPFTFTAISSLDININGLGFDSSDQLYGTGGSGFYLIDTSTGEVTLISTNSEFTSSGDIVFDDENNWFWATSVGGGTDVLYSITLDGTFVEIGDIGFDEVFGITLDSQGTLVGYSSSGEQLVIDKATGAGTLINSVSPLSASILGATEYVEPSSFSGLIGSELQLEILSPDLETALITPISAVIGDGVEFATPYPGQTPNVVEHSIDVDENSIAYQISLLETPSTFGGGSFNGYVLTDIADTLPAITSVTINAAETTLGIEASDITFNENQIFANVEGVSFSPGDTFTLDVSFDPVEPPEPLPGLDVQILTPTTISPGEEGVVTVIYTNVSDADLVAPVLEVDADNASLRLFGEDDATEDPIQLLAINPDGPAGVLSPGASGTFFLSFAPLANDSTDIDFTVNTFSADTAIDWNAFRDEIQPSYITDEAWDAIYDNFIDSVGSTTDSYGEILAENATYLDQLGETGIEDVARLVAFELQQASDYQSLAQRYSLGSFGRGRFFVGDIEAIADDEGNVAIANGGTQRLFTLQSDGTYAAAAGDNGTLTLTNGVYRLTEQSGTVTVFNTDGQLNFIEDTNENRITAQYTGDQLTGLTATNGDSLTFTRNAEDLITAVTDSTGRTTSYAYNGELLTTVTAPEGTTSYTYDDDFALTSITDSNGVEASFEYDERGRLISESFNGGVEEVTYSYGENGEVTVTDADGATTQLRLNDRGQVGQLTDALGRTLNITYDATGNATGITAPDGSSLSFTYDDAGNLRTQVNPLGQTTSFTYEPNFSALASVTDPRGNALAYGYDDAGNLTTITYADGSSESFNYDDEGNVIESTNRRNQAIDYAYNDRGQLLTQSNPGAAPQTYTYDARGNLTAATDASGTITLAYDASDRLTQITYPNGRSLTYTYDAGGRRTSMTDGDGNQVNYSYDVAGRLSQLKDETDALIVTYSYDDVGRLEREDNGNGTYTTYTYDLAGQLRSITNFAPDDSVNSSYSYSYDALGQQIGVDTLDGSWTYSYDATGQLTEAVFTSTNPEIPNQNLTYEYDAAGNRTRTIINGETTNYTANNLNQYENAGTVVYDYDADGNLISRIEGGVTQTYEYNPENRLIRVADSDGNETLYEYDALGNRTATVYNGERTEYLIDPFGLGDVVAEYGDGGLIAHYTHGIGLVSRDDGSATAFYDSNAIGSTVGMTNGLGTQVNSYSYLPFGGELIETEASTNPFEFVGQWGVMEDANGLDFMRARFYDNGAGRFTSQDPLGLLGGDLNLYSYVANHPLTRIDPEGEAPILLAPIFINASIGLGSYVAGNLLFGEEVTLRGAIGATFTGAALGGVFSGASTIARLPGGAGAAAQVGIVGALGVSNIGIYIAGGNPLEVFLAPFDYVLGRGGRFLAEAAGSVGELGEFIAGVTGQLFKNLSQDSLNELINADSELAESSTNVTSDDSLPNAPDNQARSKGEPHLTTFDGVGYSFQGAGEFTLLKSTDSDLDIQVRYVEIDRRATVANAVATLVDGQRVVIDSQGVQFVDGRPVVRRVGSGTATVTVDGEVVDIALGGSITVGNSQIFRSSGEKYTIVYAGEDGIVSDGDDQLIVDYMRPGTINIVDVALGDEKQGQIVGLLGNLNGDPADDIALPDGTVLPRPLPFDQLYGAFRDGWRVQDISESLFNYADGQSPDTFYNPNFPVAPVSFTDLSPELQAIGEAAALAAGYTPGTFEFISAAFDFAITNDPAFLEGQETDPGANEIALVVDNQGGGGNPGASLVDFNGADIQLQVFFPSVDIEPIDTRVARVGEGIEFSLGSFDDDLTDNLFSPGYSIDFSDASIVYEAVTAPVESPTYRDADFNGLVFTDIADSLPAITGVVIDSSQTTFAIDISDVSFTEDTISINLEGISYTPGEAIKLDVSFAQNNIIVGGPGDDLLEGTDGNDTISGEAGDDFIVGGDGDDVIRGGDGFDTVFGQGGNDTIEGGAQRDKLDGGSGEDTLIGEGGDDLLKGARGDDTLVGGPGSDIYVYRSGDGMDVISDEGGDGIDTIFFDASINSEDVSFSQNVDNPMDLDIQFATPGDFIKVVGHFSDSLENQIEVFNFNDEIVLSLYSA